MTPLPPRIALLDAVILISAVTAGVAAIVAIALVVWP